MIFIIGGEQGGFLLNLSYQQVEGSCSIYPISREGSCSIYPISPHNSHTHNITRFPYLSNKTCTHHPLSMAEYGGGGCKEGHRPPPPPTNSLWLYIFYAFVNGCALLPLGKTDGFFFCCLSVRSSNKNSFCLPVQNNTARLPPPPKKSWIRAYIMYVKMVPSFMHHTSNQNSACSRIMCTQIQKYIFI